MKSLPTALNSLPQLSAREVTIRVPSLRQTLCAGERSKATGRPRHMMTMKTIYVDDDTEPAVFLLAFKPRLMAPPTMGLERSVSVSQADRAQNPLTLPLLLTARLRDKTHDRQAKDIR